MQSLGSDISPITLSVENVDQNILRVKMGANGRFEVPGSLFQNTGQGDSFPLHVAQAKEHSLLQQESATNRLQEGHKMAMHIASQHDHTCCAGRVQGNPKYGLQYSASPFGYAVTRVGSSTAALFNTAGNRIVFKVCCCAFKGVQHYGTPCPPKLMCLMMRTHA